MTSKKNTILFATKNPGKLKEFKKTFDRLNRNRKVISFTDLHYDIPDCEETGNTFEENALLKIQNARHYLRGTDKEMIVIADDSGMKIASLNGEPGGLTRRWNGSKMSDDEIIDYCLEKIKGYNDRSASYISCIVVSTPNNFNKVITSESNGVILQEPKNSSIMKGLPFRSLFFVPILNLMFHEVRDLPVEKRNGYILAHESAIEQIATYLDSNTA